MKLKNGKIKFIYQKKCKKNHYKKLYKKLKKNFNKKNSIKRLKKSFYISNQTIILVVTSKNSSQMTSSSNLIG